MTLQRVLAGLGTRYPAEDRMVPDTDRITLLADLMGNPQRSYPAVHLTGTNGKTSTARMVDSLLRAFGLRPGRYTSPHLDSITERMTIDGEPLEAVAVIEADSTVPDFVLQELLTHPSLKLARSVEFGRQAGAVGR